LAHRAQALVFLGCILAAAAAAHLGAGAARADRCSHANIYDDVNYWVVEEDELRVCHHLDKTR
jgi:hypothetical protein